MTAAPRRLKLILSYDGAAYHGFQRQRPGLVTVQDVLFDAISRVCGGPPERFAAAGRTDAGVHARGQVVAFDTTGTVPTDRLVPALNANLPPDVSVVAASEVAGTFHPRFDAVGKTYAYSFYGWGRAPRQPLLDRYSLYTPAALDPAAMDAAAATLCGRHDFRAFQDTGRPVTDATRTVAACRVLVARSEHPPWRGLDLGWVEVQADGFLYHMVRIIAGTLIDVGRGRLASGDLAQALAGGRRGDLGPTVPPRGLCLLAVHYRGPNSAP